MKELLKNIGFLSSLNGKSLNKYKLSTTTEQLVL